MHSKELIILFSFIFGLVISNILLIFVIDLQIPYSLDLLLNLIIFSFIFQRLREKQNRDELGFSIRKISIRNSFYVILFSIYVTTYFLLILYLYNLFGGLELKVNSLGDLNMINILNGSIYLLVAATIEDVIFRGLAFQIIEKNFGKFNALFITSLTFAILHLNNANADFLGIFNIFLAGILFGLIFIETRTLYPVIIYHFLWNFTLRFIINSPVSGINYGDGLINYNFHSFTAIQVFIFGGSFGLESGFLTTIILTIITYLSLKYLEKDPYIMSKHFKMEFTLNNYFHSRMAN